MIRAVLDTNVYVAALLSRHGNPARIMRALSDGAFDAVVCPSLMSEFEGVLARPKLAKRVSASDALPYLMWIERVAVLEGDPSDTPAVSPDPGDDFILALAQEAGAQVIVSGDQHLLGLENTDVRVLSPAAFAALLDSLA